MAGTQKPCPGCGDTSWRPVKEVCNSCKQLMEDGRNFHKYIKLLKDREDQQVVIIPENWCTPKMYFRDIREGRDRDIVAECLRDLALAVSTPTKIKNRLRPETHKTKFHLFKKKTKCGSVQGHPFNYNKTVLMDKNVAGLLHRLHFAIERMSIRIRSEAVQYGKSLLMQLQDGDITLLEFKKEV